MSEVQAVLAVAPPELNTKCVKCGIQSPRVLYLRDIDQLRFACQCCGYEWMDLPLDHPDRKSLASVTPLRPVASGA